MAEYDLSPKMKRMVALINKITITDPEGLTPKRIEELNDISIPNNLVIRKLLGKSAKNITTKTFIIPVTDGMISGYLFEKQGSRGISDLTPLIIFYHGGGWVWGNMDLYNFLCAHLADITGAAVLSVDYRLAPKYKFPTAVEDCYDTLVWAAAGCRYWKTDPDRIFLIGDSAGGNLAAVVSRLARDRKGPSIAGQVLLYPVTDGRMRTNSYEKHKDAPSLTDKQMAFFINNYQREPKDILNPNFSPLLAKDHSRLPETLIIGAEYDPLHDDGMLYADALASADTPVKYLEVKKTIHGFINYPKATGTEETESAIIQFISGRPVAQVALISRKEWAKAQKKELKKIKKQSKHYIDAGSV
ncbi:MAG: alpha/beta hydrolase [Spirochaetaceae bacterium]|jgi:acetyl esterase|nr:alpha/beta hydrolase [Spirochaetaceae bacterium]